MPRTIHGEAAGEGGRKIASDRLTRKDASTKRRPPPASGMYAIRDGTLCRVMRGGGSKRTSGTARLPMRIILYCFNWAMLKNARAEARNAGRKTVTAQDMIGALGVMGRKIYGASSE